MLLPLIVKSVPSPSIFSPSLPNVRPMLAGRFTSPTGVSVMSAVDDMFATCAKCKLVVVPSQASLIRSNAASLSATANTRSVSLRLALNVSSTSAHILAPTKIASVPALSRGAWKSMRPSIPPSTFVSSPVDNFSVPAPAAVAPCMICVSALWSYNEKAPVVSPKNFTSYPVPSTPTVTVLENSIAPVCVVEPLNVLAPDIVCVCAIVTIPSAEV